MMKEYSDADLIVRIKKDERFAFDLLFDRYWRKLYQTAQARLNDDVVSQDIVQEIFIKIWQRRASIQIRTSLENYLQSAVRLSVISHFRSKKVTHVQMEDALERVQLLESSIDSLKDYYELERTLEEAVNDMPEMLKKVYLLRTENHSVKAIAGELGIADQTVKNYLSEVSRRLRLVIKEKFPEKHLTYLAIIVAAFYK
jgi:RNA polymerase sigma-70 factor (ECF subfamily)